METHCVDLAREFWKRGTKVSAVVPEPSEFDALAARFEAAGAAVIRLNTTAWGEGRAEQLKRLPRLLSLIRQVKPDVIHLHTGGATGGLIVILAARLGSRATVVVTEHDVPAERPAGRDRLARSAMDRLQHGLVAVSRRNAGIRIERLGVGRRPIAVILNGVPIPPDSATERGSNRSRVRRELGLAPDSMVIGSLVRLAPGKGLNDLVHAFALVRQSVPSELLLVGEGPSRQELTDLAATLGVSDHVHMPGSQTDTCAFLNAMDIFALAVPAGSMSIALLEAMAQGLPPVITFCGPEEAVVPEVTGLCAPPNNPEGLGEVLIRLAGDQTLREGLGTAAAGYIRSSFSVGRVADDLEEVYRSCRQGLIPPRLLATSPESPL
jgi:glycosyltransferase involved in cell wall biosynthesis